MRAFILEIFGSLAFIYHFFKSSLYREHMKMMYIGTKKRFKETTIALRGVDWLVPDVASFYSTYEELLRREIYAFKPKHNNPVILDFGANIGMSVYYFAQKYPTAQIYAYEADPDIFKYLMHNVKQFDNGNIHLINKAVYDKDTTLHFYSEGADGGHVSDDNKEGRTIDIEAVDSKLILDKFSNIDFLKVDIEAAEREVIPRIKEQLSKVDSVFIEYHSERNKKQCLSEIINILNDNNFRLYIKSEQCPKQPLYNQEQYGDFDLQLNIFGIKE